MAPAHLFAILDAGLHSCLRTLDIRFSHEDHKADIPQMT